MSNNLQLQKETSRLNRCKKQARRFTAHPFDWGSQLTAWLKAYIMEVDSMLLGSLLGLVTGLLGKILGIVGGIGLL